MPSLAHFGLGDASQADRLTIYWPSGTVQTLTDLEVDRHLEVTENSPDPRIVNAGASLAKHENQVHVD
jgi:hypothetical protein